MQIMFIVKATIQKQKINEMHSTRHYSQFT